MGGNTNFKNGYPAEILGSMEKTRKTFKIVIERFLNISFIQAFLRRFFHVTPVCIFFWGTSDKVFIGQKIFAYYKSTHDLYKATVAKILPNDQFEVAWADGDGTKKIQNAYRTLYFFSIGYYQISKRNPHFLRLCKRHCRNWIFISSTTI